MKIALCMSGHMRNFNKTFNSLNEFILKHYDCDIFIHTWDKLGYSSEYKGDCSYDDICNSIDLINQLYKPKNIIIEGSEFINKIINELNSAAPHLANTPKPPGHMASMFYKIYACNELRKYYEYNNNAAYDYVIRLRPDLLFDNKLILPKIHNEILISSQHSKNDWYSDLMLISKPYEMDLFCSAYFYVTEYLRNHGEYIPEIFLKKHMSNVNIVAKQHLMNFSILR